MSPASPSSASLDRLLALLVGLEVFTGLLTLEAGSPALAWVFVLHGLVSGALALAIGLKVGRSLPRALAVGAWRRVGLGTAVTVAASGAIAGGFAWVASGRLLRLGPWTVLTLHAWAGLVLVPLVIVHLLPRRWRILRPGPAAIPTATDRVLSRRALLFAGVFTTASVALFGAGEWLDRSFGGERRFTGSRALPPGGVPPSTTFLGDSVPTVDPAAWRLRIHGLVERVRVLSTVDLGALPETNLDATLDCTSGWAMTTTWRGVAVPAVLALARPKSRAEWLVVRSVTGWTTRIPIASVDRLLLATSVAGGPLPAGNGAPCRLVVPDRRGLDWVKWVSEIEVA